MERIGVEFTTNEGQQVIVIDYVNNAKVQVMFLDEHKWTTWTTWNNLKNGELKNPFYKSIYGVGYLGIGEKPKNNMREYRVWYNMMYRCYDEKFHEKEPTYKNCTVSEEWHDFSKFLEDLPKIKNYELWRDNPNERISLDKDFYYADLGIITDEKEYSLLTTRFITYDDNVKEMHERYERPLKPTKKIRCVETGKIYDSIKQASEETGLNHGNIIKCCRGKLKTCGKLHWEYVE